jgi:hypothetical protein
MSKKKYNDSEYYAQEFTRFLTTGDDISTLIGGYLAAKHKGNRVLFNISGVDCDVAFDQKNNRAYTSLDMKIYRMEQKKEGDEVKLVPILEDSKSVPKIYVRPSKSRQGRISQNPNPGFNEYLSELVHQIQVFYKGYSSKKSSNPQ